MTFRQVGHPVSTLKPEGEDGHARQRDGPQLFEKGGKAAHGTGDGEALSRLAETHNLRPGRIRVCNYHRIAGVEQ